ncbi:sodium:solute symporter family protein [Streptomyces sp. RB6PN25]|uniref:Sodium:solute symporter family protein n=1 Tax=Streptomyces humicola TaxID=2953240 RepID=A0ABT1PXJ2_9ACTN|nr:sodium:solute symporter family protein [Streptomyces humicola]MCQ4082382.1 sodium:solute symporter family protein [Streptomyces humicola]
MSTVLVVTLVGMAVIAAVGLLGRRRPSADLAQWSVGGRRFGSATMWFLQAGETFTTFTFLGVAGLAFTGGVAATYSIPYVPLAVIVLYFLGPRVWRLGREHGYLTQADFYEQRFGSRALGTLVALLGVIFMLPYLQLQITGLGLIVKLVTGDGASSTLGMVIGTSLTATFVLWAGIRGVAATSYLKDVLMIVAVAVIIVVVPLHFTGGIGHAFTEIAHRHTQLLTVHTGPNDRVWWTTSMLASAIGAGFLTFPHSWPALLSARSERGLRRNWVFLPLYQIALILPMTIGFVAVLALPPNTNANGVLLTLTGRALPGWATGFIAVAGAAAAMVPAAVMVLAMSTLIARNVVRSRSPRLQFLTNHGAVVAILALALVLALVRPNALTDLLLLTYSGLVQFAPGLVAGLARRPLLGRIPVLLGMVVGEAVVVWLTFAHVDVAHINAGIVGLGVNVVVAALVHVAERATGRSRHEQGGRRQPEPLPQR